MKINTFTTDIDAKYIQNCWKQFTTLTEQEEKNLKEIIKNFKIKSKRNQTMLKTDRKKRKIYCIELKKTFKTQRECAEFFNVNPSYICQVLEFGYKIKKKYTLKRLSQKNPAGFANNKDNKRKTILWITLR